MYHASDTTYRLTANQEQIHYARRFWTAAGMALLLALCQSVTAGSSPVPESGMLSLCWDAPETTVHHYVLEITKTAGDDMADPETITAYTDGTVYDLPVLDGYTYAVSISSVDAYGNRSLPSDDAVFSVENNTVITKSALNDDAFPREFSLNQNHPNPFNPVTTISYNLPSDSHVTLTIYNITGQKVAVLQDGRMAAGSHAVVWDANNMPSGTYFYLITTNQHRVSKKMLLLK